MYVHFTDQIIHMFHYFFSFFLILVLVPNLFFINHFKEQMEGIYSNFLKMGFILVCLGYVLVIFKLFEIISIVFLLALIGKRLYAARKKSVDMEQSLSNFEALIYDYFDGKYKLTQVIRLYTSQKYKKLRMYLKEWISSPERVLVTTFLLIVFSVAIYLRFFDAFSTIAPSYGNRYTTLKWVKDIRNNQLFSDGILPQGFRVFWAVIQEFTRIDTLYMVKWTGPFIQILIIVGIYFVISRVTGNRVAGVIATIIYSLLGEYIDPHFWDWQIDTDSSTFVHVFFLPTLYFLVIYLRETNVDAFQAMFAGMALTAFIHPITLVSLFLGVCVTSIVLYFTKQKRVQSSIPKVFFALGVGVGLSIIPLLIGLISGKEWHPAFFQTFGFNVNNQFTLTESASVLPLVLSSVSGFLWYYIFNFFPDKLYKKIVEQVVLGAVLIMCFLFTTLQPVQPIKIDWESSIDQYIRISKEFTPRTWMIVTKASFTPIVQGVGYHMNIDYLINNYDPMQEHLTLYYEDKPDLNVAPHVFIFYEKSIRQADHAALQQLIPFYKKWKNDTKELRQWMDQYLVANTQTDIYYEDENIIIYYLEREVEREEINSEIWGER